MAIVLNKDANQGARNPSDSDEDEGTRLFVHGLRNSMTKETLVNIFRTVAEPKEVSFVMGSKFAHVTFKHVREAEMAIRTINLAPPYNLIVDFARPKEVNKYEQPHGDGPELRKFRIDELETQPILSRRLEELHALSTTEKSFYSNSRKPLPGIKIIQRDPYCSGDRVVMYGRGYYIPSANRKANYSVHADIKGYMPVESKTVTISSCACCSASTGLKCSGCSAFYCSTLCMTQHKYMHSCFCEKQLKKNAYQQNDQSER